MRVEVIEDFNGERIQRHLKGSALSHIGSPLCDTGRKKEPEGQRTEESVKTDERKSRRL